MRFDCAGVFARVRAGGLSGEEIRYIRFRRAIVEACPPSLLTCVGKGTRGAASVSMAPGASGRATRFGSARRQDVVVRLPLGRDTAPYSAASFRASRRST